MELLNDMALFVEVVKARSFRRAAEVIGMPNSTLSRRISGLEKAIGLRLLHRTTRRIELTEAGRLYFERCKRIVDEARLAHEQLGEMLAQPSGVLRLAAGRFREYLPGAADRRIRPALSRHQLRIRPHAAEGRSGGRTVRRGDPHGRARRIRT